MAKCVSEIMSRSVFAVRPDDDSDLVLREIVALGITGVPVVDDDGRPLGMASFRDLLAAKTSGRVFERMSKPAVGVPAEATIEDAARLAAEAGVHRLVVTGADGALTGVVSSLDLIRGLMGLPAPHPATYPVEDAETRTYWCEDAVLDVDQVGVAPDAPGVLALIRGGRGLEERLVWVEMANNVRTRLYDLVSEPQTDTPELERILRERGHIRFRATAVADPERRRLVYEALQQRVVRRLDPANVVGRKAS